MPSHKPSPTNHQRRGRRATPQALIEVQQLTDDIPKTREQLVELLHRLQDCYGRLYNDHLVALAQQLKLAPTEVHEVASFYHHFDLSDKPPADQTAPIKLRVCDSISCQLGGSDKLLNTLQQQFGDQLEIQPVPCVGRCAEAPVAVLGQQPIGQADSAKVGQALSTGQVQASIPTNAETYRDYRNSGGYRLLHGFILEPRLRMD